MKTASLLLAFPLMLPVCTTHAGPRELKADGRYRFLENGRPADYVIARDEVMRRSNSNRIFLSARDNLRSVQATARQLSAQTGDRVDLVAYPEGKTPSDENRRVVSRSVVLKLAEGVDPMVIASAVNALSYRSLPYAPGHYNLRFSDSQSALSAAEDLRGIEGISDVTVELAKKYYPKALPSFTDNQLYFATSEEKGQAVNIWYDFTNQTPMEPGIPFGIFDKDKVVCYQWYLNNTGEQIDQTTYYPASPFGTVGGIEIPPPLPGIYIPDRVPQFATPNDLCTYNSYFDIYADIRALNAWSQTTPEGAPIDGSGVSVAVMDDGVQISHEDLSASALLDKNNSYNFVTSGGIIDKTNTDFRDPSPTALGNFIPSHGTAVAGIAVGRANGKGGVGVAYGAKLSGFAMATFMETSTVSDMLTWGADRLELRPGEDPGEEGRRNQPKFDVSINSWGRSTSGAYLNDEDLYIKRGLAYGALKGRDGKGVIYLFPAGNEAATHGNANYSYLSNSIFSIHVGSVTDMGRRVLHSSPGAPVHVVAPSAGYEMMPAIVKDGAVFPTYPPVVPAVENFAQRSLGYTVTPDDYDAYKSAGTQARSRNTQFIIAPDSAKTTGGGPPKGYNHNFAGTSASNAMVGGVVALMLQANPNLGWRDVQEILMRSATVVDPLFGEWSYNSMGMPVSHKYGAGLVNAGKAVAMAKIWKNLGAPEGLSNDEYKGKVESVSTSRNIPDNNPEGVVVEVNAPPPGMRVEQVMVKVSIEHPRRGDLGIVLTAPRAGQADAEYGVESHLLVPHREDATTDIVEYEFTTMRHWGTRSDGNPALIPGEEGGSGEKWKLKIWDNNKFGKVGVAGAPALNVNSNKLENGVYVERVIMPEDNNTAAGKFRSAEVHYYGTTVASENLAPVIEGEKIVGRPGKALYYPVNAITDLSPVEGSGSDAPRAPILSYQFRVLGNKVSGQKTLFTSPNSLAGWLNAFPIPEDDATNPLLEYPSFRFGLQDGVLTNVLTPNLIPAYQFVMATGKGGEKVLTSLTGTAGLKPDMYALGKGIGSRAKIVEVTETTITLDTANLGSVEGIVRFTDQGPSTGVKGESTIKVQSTDGLTEGLYVYGNNTGASARIAAIDKPAKLITLTVPNKDDVNEVLFFTDIEYFWEPNLVVKATGKRGQNKIVVDDPTWLRQGLYVGGLGITPGSKVSNIDTKTNTVLLTQPLTDDLKGDKDGKGEVLFNGIRMFNTLEAGEWIVEASATNIFGTTRRRFSLEIRDRVTYDEWKNTYYPPITDPNGDPDGDGRVNLIEFVSGGDPYAADGEFITTSVVDGKQVISYTLDSNALSPVARPQISSDLSTWTQAVPVEGTKTGSLVNYTVTLDSNEARQFFRIKVQL